MAEETKSQTSISPNGAKGKPDWGWIRTQWETGRTYAEIAKAYENATGLAIPIASMKTRNHREGWSREGLETVLTVEPEKPTVGNLATVHSGVILKPGMESLGSGRVPRVIPAASPSIAQRAPELIRAELELSKVTQRHDNHRKVVAEAALDLIDAARTRLAALTTDSKGIDTKDLKNIGDALARGADMLGTNEDRERKAKGLDRPEVVNPQQQGVTQILINVQAPPVVPTEIPD